MLTGQDATHLDTEPQDVGPKRLGSFDLVGVIGVVQNEGVKIAVACMEYVSDPKLVLVGQPTHAAEDFRQA